MRLTSLSKPPLFLVFSIDLDLPLIDKFAFLIPLTRIARLKLKNTPFNAFLWSRMCTALWLSGPPGGSCRDGFIFALIWKSIITQISPVNYVDFANENTIKIVNLATRK